MKYPVLPAPEILTCENCLRRKYSLFIDLTIEELAVLNRNRYCMTYQEGETIFREGARPTGLFCLQQGKIKIVRRGVDDTEQIVALKKPADFIGLKALMQESAYPATAVALETTTVCVIDKKDFQEVVRHNSRLPFAIIRQLAKELDETQERLLTLTKKHLRARLADGLFWLYETYGLQDDRATLNVTLKRADLAALANMTTANAIRILSAFAREHIIEIDQQRHIKILDFKGLRNISLLGR